MMKKIYRTPQTEVIKIKAHQQLLTGSPVGGRVFFNEEADVNEKGL